MAGKDDLIRDAVYAWFQKMIVFLERAITDYRGDEKSAKEPAAELFTHWQGALLMAKTSNNIKVFD